MVMKKFINKPENLVQELLEGYTSAYADKVRLAGNKLVVRTVPKAIGRVGIVTLGGSGHEPGLSGFVGEGMLDISVPGEIFAAPGAPRCLEAIRMAERGAGVLFVVLNHAGDVLATPQLTIASPFLNTTSISNVNASGIVTTRKIALTTLYSVIIPIFCNISCFTLF